MGQFYTNTFINVNYPKLLNFSANISTSKIAQKYLAQVVGPIHVVLLMFTAFNNLTESQHSGASSVTLFLQINRPEENLAKKQRRTLYAFAAINFSILISNYKGCEMRRQMTAEIQLGGGLSGAWLQIAAPKSTPEVSASIESLECVGARTKCTGKRKKMR